MGGEGKCVTNKQEGESKSANPAISCSVMQRKMVLLPISSCSYSMVMMMRLWWLEDEGGTSRRNLYKNKYEALAYNCPQQKAKKEK